MVGVAAALALAWAVLVWISGGTTIAVAGLRVSSTDPIRPLVTAALLAAIYVLTSGRQRVREDAVLARRLATASRLAAVLAAVIGTTRKRAAWPPIALNKAMSSGRPGPTADVIADSCATAA